MSQHVELPPSISHRVSLRFIPDDDTDDTSHVDAMQAADAAPLEPTRTVVLNGGGHSAIFTDFRPLLPFHPDTTAVENATTATACEWAFAGVKSHLPDGSACWSHSVDSRHAGAVDGEGDGGSDDPPDVGACQLLPDGCELERGSMRNPATGRIQAYEEFWRPELVPPGSPVRVLVRHRHHRHPSPPPPPAPSAHERPFSGAFVRVGPWAQVVAEARDGSVRARRWKLVGGGGGGPAGGSWVVDAEFGALGNDDAPHPGIATVPEVWDVVEDYVWFG
ncbi:hypothetical protein HK405_012882, partial [Cladochytrium tenue]